MKKIFLKKISDFIKNVVSIGRNDCGGSEEEL